MVFGREPTMYAEKRFELETMKDRLMERFYGSRYPVPKFLEQVFYDFGNTKTLLLIFEKSFFRGRDYEKTSMMILLTEHDGYQGADLIVTPWPEDDLVNAGVEALKDLGFRQAAR